MVYYKILLSFSVFFLCLSHSLVAINLIIQHIKDIISGKLKLEDMSGSRGGLPLPGRQRQLSESAAPLARPH